MRIHHAGTFELEVMNSKGEQLFTETGRYVVRGTAVAFTVESKYVIDQYGRGTKASIDGHRQGQLIAKHRLLYEGRTWVWTNK